MDKSPQWPSYKDKSQAQKVTLDATEDTAECATENAHLIINGNTAYAGQHLILDIWGAESLSDLALIEQCFYAAIEAANATLLHIHLHHFAQGDGVSGVAVLAESHISIHTWPERNYAAFDVFMCGETKPHEVIPILLKTFKAKKHKLTEILRGDMSTPF